jgi:hypothetical protein
VIDIEAEFRKTMFEGTASNAGPDKPLTLEVLREAMRSLGPPPPQVKLSGHAPALGRLKPTATPMSDDMRQMVDDIGEQLSPVAWILKADTGDVIFINPVNVKK